MCHNRDLLTFRFCLSENGAGREAEVSQLLCVHVCVPVPERKVRGLLCSVFYCAPACNWARLLIAVVAVGGAAGVARHPAAVSWEAGSQGRSWSPPRGPRGPANCHLFLLTLHTWGSRRCRHALHPPLPPPLQLPSSPPSPPASHPSALLTLYSSQRLSIRIRWSIGLTRSTSTLASASLITSSLHGWVFKDNWAQEPASLWVTVGWNDNQLDPVQE